MIESADSFAEGELSPLGDMSMSNDSNPRLRTDLPEDKNSARPGVATGKVRWYALVSLLLIAACLAEFLKGSTSIPLVITNPLGMVFNLGLYGGGALLIR